MQTSSVQQRGRVAFPVFQGERIYMREFTKAAGLPADIARWQSTVDAMLDGVDTDGPIFIMVDQGGVRANTTQRRPGLHVDGYWNPAIYAHGHGGQRIGSVESEAIILASDMLGCAAYVGEYEGEPGSGGDCTHIDADGLTRVEMEPGRVWAGDALRMLHEAIPVERDCVRTVVRLNVPGWRA